MTPSPFHSISARRLSHQLPSTGSASFFITLSRFKRSRHPVSDELRTTLAQIAREVRLQRVPRIWIASSISSPAVTGLLRPTLLLPGEFDQTFTPAEARLVLKHELMHLKRHDLPLNAVLCVLMALHWFNPLLWLAFFKVRLDREAACDAQVLQNDSSDRRREYGHVLLKVETAFCPRGLSLGFVGIFQRGSALRSRIHSIATQPNPHPIMKATHNVCIVLLTFLGITKAAPPDKNAPQMLIEAKFIEVSDGAKDLLAPFATSAASPSVGGMLNDDQLSALWKKIEQAKGVDVVSMPRATTRSGQKAKILISREFRYKDAVGKLATKELGTTLTVIATKGGENDIDLELTPQIIELKSMIKDPKSGAEQPVFSERKASASVTMMSGQTVVLGLPSTSTVQTTEDRSAGSVTTKTENVTRNTMVFVTARLVDPATSKPDDPKTAAGISPLQAKLDSIILPSVVFADAALTEAVEFLRQKSLDLDTTTTDPNQKGVNMIVKAGDKYPDARITLNLKNIPLGEALKHVAQLSNLRLVVERHAVTMLSQADFEAQQKQVESSAPNKAGMVITAKSISIDKGTGVVDASGDVKIKTSQATISTEQARVETTPSAGKIILPLVQFHEATLAEAIEFIRIKSRDLDPGKKGVNILLKGDGGTVKITLSLKDVPVSEALRYCAELASHKLSDDNNTFVLTPPGSK